MTYGLSAHYAENVYINFYTVDIYGNKSEPLKCGPYIWKWDGQ